MPASLLCTLGPASMNEPTISRLEDLGVSLFRINLSHTKLKDLPDIIDFLQGCTSVPICLDSEGAQVRTGDFVQSSVMLHENSIIKIHRRRVPGDERNFNLYPTDILDQLKLGDFISIDFNAVLVQVVGFEPGIALMRVINGGPVGRNKAVTVQREIPMDPLTAKDLEAAKIGRAKGIHNYALSFANRVEDVFRMREAIGDGCKLISKIESLSALANLESIAKASDAVLIDRGDLSRQVPIEQIPYRQKEIIRRAKAVGCRVYVATNLLESMVSSPNPTRAEVNDIYNTLSDGADGLVLAAETAIGNYPIQCANMIVKVIQTYENPNQSSFEAISLLIPPHGGRLVQHELATADTPSLAELPKLMVSDTDLMDCEQLAYGTYSPLDGFMDSETLNSVLADCRLPDGTVWTMPVLLQFNDKQVLKFGPGDRVALASQTGRLHAVLDVSQSYEIDNYDVCAKWFGTASDKHPGVNRVKTAGVYCLAGRLTMVERLDSEYRHYELTPAQTRFIFAHKGWSRVVAFHTRNPVHQGHEYIQRVALAKVDADGLYINPVIGPKKAGDFLAGPIMASYQAMLEFAIYPRGKVVLGSFATYSRYAGPREAVFTALCRKNMGCSHFIIGRDHTGVGDFYAADANRRLFGTLGDIGIQPVFFDAVAYDPKTDNYLPEGSQADLLPISGTRIREALRDGTKVPEWMVRDIVQEVLLDEVRVGRPLFCE